MTTKTREESYCDFCGEDRRIEGTLYLENKLRWGFGKESIKLELCEDCFYSMIRALEQKKKEAMRKHGD